MGVLVVFSFCYVVVMLLWYIPVCVFSENSQALSMDMCVGVQLIGHRYVCLKF